VAVPEVAGEGVVQQQGLELTLMAFASLVALAGIALAARLYLQRPDAPARIVARFPGLYRFLLNKGYVDEIYNEALVQPIKSLSEEALWHGLDSTMIDGAVNGTATMAAFGGGVMRALQTGSVRAYAVSAFLGAVLIAGYYLWR